MPCYSPLAFVPRDPGSDVKSYKCIGKYYPEYKRDSSFYEPGLVKVPCGKCLGCRLDYSREWADRMMIEWDSSGRKAIFLTLTYDEKHVPPLYDCDEFGEVCKDSSGEAIPCAYTLCKRDLQLAFKRLRDHLPADKKIRYYACGEYGSHPKTGKYRRPHYHAIIFGISLDDFTDKYPVDMNELKQVSYSSPTLVRYMWTCPEDGLPYGRISISDISYRTCAYVARYTMKKVFNVDHPDFCEPEFVVMSRRPGIGSKYLELNPEWHKRKHIYIRTGSGSVECGIPKFFLQKLHLSNPDLYDNIISERRKFADDNELLALKRSTRPYHEQLENDQNILFNKTKILFKRREEAML